jgi:hypothetical protein
MDKVWTLMLNVQPGHVNCSGEVKVYENKVHLSEDKRFAHWGTHSSYPVSRMEEILNTSGTQLVLHTYTLKEENIPALKKRLIKEMACNITHYEVVFKMFHDKHAGQ